MNYEVKILSREWLTHDVIHWHLEQPDGFHYTAGQAIELSLPDAAFKDKWSPFTMTSLDGAGYLEFMTKIYPDHHGLTEALSQKQVGDSVLITEAWDSFKFIGPGVFLAGGTGITPFIALIRQLKKDQQLANTRLFFSNKTPRDVFMAKEFQQLLGDYFHNILTQENAAGSHFGRIDKAYLQKEISNFNQPFYVCGPDGFIEELQATLIELGVEKDLVDLNL